MYSEEEYKRPDSSESYLLDQWVRIRVHNWYMQGGGGTYFLEYYAFYRGYFQWNFIL